MVVLQHLHPKRRLARTEPVEKTVLNAPSARLVHADLAQSSTSVEVAFAAQRRPTLDETAVAIEN